VLCRHTDHLGPGDRAASRTEHGRAMIMIAAAVTMLIDDTGAV
jgi:hypothetical protein